MQRRSRGDGRGEGGLTAPANETRVLLQTLTTLTRRERAFETSVLSVETEKLAVGYNEIGRALCFVLECGVCCNDIHFSQRHSSFYQESTNSEQDNCRTAECGL